MPQTEQMAQGELLLVRLSEPPDERELVSAVTDSEIPGRIIVGHSETGHHHTVEARAVKLWRTKNPLLDYMQVVIETQLEHTNLAEDSHHKPLPLTSGWIAIRHQADETPDGWARVQD